MDFKKDYSRNYGLEQHVYDMTRGADMTSPQRCSIVVDVLCSWEDCKVDFATWTEALYHFVIEILDYLNRDSYLFNIWYEERLRVAKVDKTEYINMQEEMIDLVKRLMADAWCEKIEETLYNYAD